MCLILVDDDLFEAAESFLLTLGSIENAKAPTRDVLVTILDNDPAPALLYSDQTLVEGPNNPTFIVPLTLANVAGQDIRIDFTLEQPIEDVEDDLRFDRLSVLFPAGQTRAS